MFFIFKLTDKCNLRCKYCFEQEGFKNPRVLTLADMELILNKFRTYCLQKSIKSIIFHYTGGEVLTLGKEYLTSLFKLSRQVFEESAIETGLEIQTNLTLMDEEYIDILKKHNVTVGVSFDVAGDQRRFEKDEIVDRIIMDKMNLMFKNNLRFREAIAVITRKNYKNASQIYDFYKKIQTNFYASKLRPWPERFCPELIISDQEYIEFLKALADRHLEQKEPKIFVSPLDSYIGLLKNGPGYEKTCLFSRNCRFPFMEPNGDIYPCNKLRDKDLYLGNIFRDSLENILGSPILANLDRRYESIREECRGCRYLEICNGGCFVFARWEGNILGRSKSVCAVNRAMFEYIGKKLEKQGHKLYPATA